MSSAFKQFKRQATTLTHDLRHREIIQTALGKFAVVRDKHKAAFQDWQSARQAAAETKWEAVNHLDKHLEQLVSKLEARGTRVHWASTAQQAREIIIGIIHGKNARSIVKSKAMTSEEIHLNEALQHEGFDVVESDLGEFIVQLRKEPPYHIVFPAMHLTRGEIRDVFARELGSKASDNPEELTMVARGLMRRKYIKADAGFTGANFAIAETGMISVTENEGNARLTAALPKTMITLLGIEKVLPRLEDLALFLPMLATAGAGQALTGYNTLYAGPRQPGEADGPEEYHVVLLDNRRTELLAVAEQRDALHCIRCGACLNACPIFRNIGGHTYGTTYSGPIGSVITPHLRGLQEWKHLSYSSSLCAACTEACPVKIDLAHHLLQNRRNASQEKPSLLWKSASRCSVSSSIAPAFTGSSDRLAASGSGCIRSSRARRSIRPIAGRKPAKRQRLRRKRSRNTGETGDEFYHEIHETHEIEARRLDHGPCSCISCVSWLLGLITRMNEREKILGRIREALTVAAPMPGEHNGAGRHASVGTPPSAHASEWLPAVGPTFDEQLALFRTNATNLKADFHFVNNRDELAKSLLKLRDTEGWKKVASHTGELTDAACKILALPVCKTDSGYNVNEMEACDAGITECDALIAQTGSVLVTSRSTGGRALSVLPPHHVVLARRNQLLRDLPAAFQFLKKKYGSNYPSMISFVTGPSRTGDIERILVLGAHGPKKLTIFLL